MDDFPFKPPSAGVGIPPTNLLLEHIPSTVPQWVSVDVEMAMLFVGARLFRTDEAILTPDWLPNDCIFCVYNAAEREFFWSNRAYAAGRKSYLERVRTVQRQRGRPGPGDETQSKRGRGMDLLLEQWSSFLTGVELGKFFALVHGFISLGLMADRPRAKYAVQNLLILKGRNKFWDVFFTYSYLTRFWL